MKPTPKQITAWDEATPYGTVADEKASFATLAYQAGAADKLAELRAGGVALPPASSFTDWFDVKYEKTNGYVSSGDPMLYNEMQHAKCWARMAWEALNAKVQDYGDRGAAAAVPHWLPIESAPRDGTLVVVYWPNGPDDWPDGLNVTFDYVCPDYEDWFQHCEAREHYLMVGGPNAAGPDCVCTGPSEKAPYTHWMPLPAAPTPPKGGV